MKNYLIFIALLFVFAIGVAAQPEKLSADQIVARHVASIGTPDAIAASTSRVLTGSGSLVSKLPRGFMLSGQGQMASTPHNVLFALVFQNPTYPYEKAAYDGQNASYGLPSGKTSMLGNYLKAQSAILKDGLLEGSLSAAWPLLDLKSAPKVKLEAAGFADVDGRPCYKVKYSSSRTGEMKVVLYFDAATFHHVRTEYHYTIEPSIGTSSTDVRSTSRIERYDMTEDFADFKQAGKLALPTTYKITISTEGQIESVTGTNLRIWSFTVDSVYFDQTLKPEIFKVS